MTSVNFVKNKKESVYAAFAFALFCLIVQPVSASGGTITITTGGKSYSFTVEVMDTPEQRAQGLMHRKFLAPGSGMLFDFETPRVARMWMMNTYIPLDMLFIREDWTIANIAENTTPLSTDVLASSGKVRYVLEINAGLSAQYGFASGLKVVFND